MYHRIKPTWIGVNRRLSAGVGYDDYESLMRLFTVRLRVAENDVEPMPYRSESYAVYLDKRTDKQPTIGSPPKPDSGDLPWYDATRTKLSRQLNEEVVLLVNEKHYSEQFATKR